MRKLYFTILTFTFFTLTLSGCLVTRSAVREREQQVETQAQVKAQNTAQMVEVDENLRGLRGRVEEVENGLNQIQMQSRSVEAKHQESEKALAERLRVYQETLEKLEAQYLLLSQKVEALQASATAPAAAAKTPAKGSFETAEDLFNKKNWKQAIVEYDKYRKSNPKGKKYSDATYKIAICFQELGMKDQAKVFYEEVVDSFPQSKTAGLAKDRLKKLK